MLRRLSTSITVLCFCGLFAYGQGLNTQASKDDWEEINFEFNSAVLSDGYPSLLRLSDLLSKHPGYHVRVEGNTDNIGGTGYNDKLGLQRANTVRDFLVKYGAKPEQIEVASRGKGNPEVHGFRRQYSKTDVARWMNRRVVLTVTDEQGRTVSAGGAAEAIKAMEPVAQGPSQCCTDIMKRLDDIAKLLQDMSAQNSNLKQQVADLQQREADLENQVKGAPKPLNEAQTANVVDQRLEQFRDRKFSLLGISLGEDTYNHDITFQWRGRYFAPFKDHFAVQANGTYDYYDAWHEGEFDLGLVDRMGPFQIGGFGSFKHVDLKGMTNGATLGQASVAFDYLFGRGKIGFFGTKAFLDNQLVGSTNATFFGPNGPTTAPNLFVDSYLHVVDQIGADATIGLWGRSYLELNGGYLRSLQHGDHGGGNARFVFPIASRVALTLEGGINPTYMSGETWGQVLAGIQWGNFEHPKEYTASDKPVPVDVPQIRWEVATRVAQRGVARPVADAGPDQLGVPAGTITLNGSRSYDPNGLALTYQWVQEQGQPVSLSGPNSAVTTFQATSGQSYAFQLTVTNTQGLSATARVRVTTQAPVAAATVPFCTATPLTITQGQTTSIIYQTQGATSVSISPGIGAVAGSGSIPVTPTKNTTYTITATNSSGSNTCTVSVQVTPLPAPQILVFTANPSTINSGQSSTLAWTVTNATSVSISGVGSVGVTGSQSVSPATTTTYTLTATNSTGSTTATATVTVNTQSTQIPVISSFTANPSTISSGGSSVLTCLATGATSVSIQGIAPVNSMGSFTVSPTATTTYTCVATNSAGSATKQVTVTVNSTGPGGGSGPPVISVPGGPIIYTTISTIQLDLTGTTSPANAYPITYSTTAVSGGVTITNGTTATPSVTVPSSNGPYQVTITATDANHLSSTYSLTIVFEGAQIFPGSATPRGSARR